MVQVDLDVGCLLYRRRELEKQMEYCLATFIILLFAIAKLYERIEEWRFDRDWKASLDKDARERAEIRRESEEEKNAREAAERYE